MLERISETTAFLRAEITESVSIAVILGTGLGKLANEIEIIKTIPYETIPNFPVSTVEGHSGKLIYGIMGGKRIIAMQGRFHYYEGYSMQEVTFPIRVFKALGIKDLIVSNASGGMNPAFKIGDIMIINDHINHFPEHPLRGKNYGELGPRFPDMSEPYKKSYIEMAKRIAAEMGIFVQEGVYVGTSGPTFETIAEYKLFRILGADAVGMSTVPEVIVARHADMNVFAVSVITDSGVPGEIKEISHHEVQQIAGITEPILSLFIARFIAQLKDN